MTTGRLTVLQAETFQPELFTAHGRARPRTVASSERWRPSHSQRESARPQVLFGESRLIGTGSHSLSKEVQASFFSIFSYRC